MKIELLAKNEKTVFKNAVAKETADTQSNTGVKILISNKF